MCVLWTCRYIKTVELLVISIYFPSLIPNAFIVFIPNIKSFSSRLLALLVNCSVSCISPLTPVKSWGCSCTECGHEPENSKERSEDVSHSCRDLSACVLLERGNYHHYCPSSHSQPTPSSVSMNSRCLSASTLLTAFIKATVYSTDQCEGSDIPLWVSKDIWLICGTHLLWWWYQKLCL